MRIILIGNYSPDNLESMDRFAQMLETGFRDSGVESCIWRPKVIMGIWFKNTNSGLGKWLGYLDKWIIFPLILKYRLLSGKFKTSNIRFHVCDHSNSPYLKYLPIDRTGITCHDVIAIRGGMGFTDTYQPASIFGKVLQKWILSGLSKAKFLAAVSQFTFNQLKDLVPGLDTTQRDWKVILNAFNADFKPIAINEARKLIKRAGLNPDIPYILHVGSNLPRKNKKLILNMLAALGDNWQGNICFAGEPLNDELKANANSLGLQDRLVSVEKPNHNTLRALYNNCEAFVFPSFSEGFGWPVIEAQACGAPVIASNIEPMPEISGGSALHANPYDPQDFAEKFMILKDNALREKLKVNGFENCKRFKMTKMINAYLNLYGIKPENI